MTKIISVALLAMGIAACSTETPTTIDSGSVAGDVEVSFAMPADATRTVIGDDGMTTHWAQGDKLAVWAKNAGGAFVFRNEVFTLRHFSDSYDKAFFSGSVAAMAEGDYTYLLSYPTPHKVIGTLATYNVSATQSGKYDGKYDIMVAEPVTHGSLTTGGMVMLNTTMRHQMHALKITIPEGRNLFGARFTRLEITFPVNVVGDVTYDINSLDEGPIYSNMSNVITVENAEGFDAGDDIWVFVLPGTVDGNVSYKVESETQRSVVNSYPLSRTLAAGHVTPIRMATPELYRYTSFVLSAGVNNLGEDFNSFQVYDKDNTLLASFARNAENRYEFGFEGNVDFTPWHNTDLRLVLDSDHAIVETTVHIGTIDHSHMNVLTPFVIPYLFAEDFSTIPSFSDGHDGPSTGSYSDTYDESKMLDGYASALAGWSGGRVGGAASQSLRMCCRLETGIGVVKKYNGRVDTAPLSAIKSGVNAKILVTFDYGAAKEESGVGSGNTTMTFGYTTNTGAIAPSSGITSVVVSGSEIADNTGSYTNLPLSYATTIDGINNATRLSWQSGTTRGGSIGGNGNYWIYVDNIKVQIAK